MDNVETTVKQILLRFSRGAKMATIDAIDGAHRLSDDLGHKLVDVVDVVMELEEKFEIRISDAEHALLIRVDDVISLVRRKLAASTDQGDAT